VFLWILLAVYSYIGGQEKEAYSIYRNHLTMMTFLIHPLLVQLLQLKIRKHKLRENQKEERSETFNLYRKTLEDESRKLVSEQNSNCSGNSKF
jgi:hypothetical protein